jgi:hypothetical protein
LKFSPTAESKIEFSYGPTSKPDNIIAAENSGVMMLSTYGRRGLSGAPMVTGNRMIGLLTKVHVDGSPLIYGIPVQKSLIEIRRKLLCSKPTRNCC